MKLIGNWLETKSEDEEKSRRAIMFLLIIYAVN